MPSEDIENRFNYHPPTVTRATQHEVIRADCLHVAALWDENLPAGREKALAITKLEEAMFWANASIARQ